MSLKDEQLTADSLFNGRLRCYQRRDGYRFSIDAVLLAHFTAMQPGSRVLDLGAGSGVVSLVLAYRDHSLKITALELQPSLFNVLQRNITANSFQGRIKPLPGDMRAINSLISPGSFEYVVCNPPYRKNATGRRNEESEQALARHEIAASLTDVLRAVRFGLKVGGRAAFVYPARRAATLISGLKTTGLEPKRLQVVYSYPGGYGKLILVESIKGGGEEIEILPPFYIYEKQGGDYTTSMAAMYEE